MAKKMFLNRYRKFAATEHPSVISEPERYLSFINNAMLRKQCSYRSLLLTTPLKLSVNLVQQFGIYLLNSNLPTSDQDLVTYLRECITALTNYLVDEVTHMDFVGLKIRNTDIV
jgi:hypothetical protein